MRIKNEIVIPQPIAQEKTPDDIEGDDVPEISEEAFEEFQENLNDRMLWDGMPWT